MLIDQLTWYARQGSNLRPLESESNALIRLSYGRSIVYSIYHTRDEKARVLTRFPPLIPTSRFARKKNASPMRYRKDASVYVAPMRVTPFSYLYYIAFIEFCQSFFMKSFRVFSLFYPFKTRAYTTDRRNRTPAYSRSRARALPHARPLFYTRSFSAARSARRSRSA